MQIKINKLSIGGKKNVIVDILYDVCDLNLNLLSYTSVRNKLILMFCNALNSDSKDMYNVTKYLYIK